MSGADSSVIAPTYWLEGAGVGTAAGAVAGGVFAVGGLKGVPGAIMIGMVGFGIGALIGGQFPKR